MTDNILYLIDELKVKKTEMAKLRNRNKSGKGSFKNEWLEHEYQSTEAEYAGLISKI